MIKTLKLVLTGGNSGKSVTLGSFQFVDGVATVECQQDDVAKHLHYAEVMYQAFPEGDPRIEQINEQVAADLAAAQQEKPNGDPNPDGERQPAPEGAEPQGSSAVHSDGDAGGAGAGTPAADAGTGDAGADGAAASAPEVTAEEPQAQVNEKLKRAVMALDPKTDSQWTADGKPQIAAVAKAYGSSAVTRADIEAVAPGFRRPV